MTQPDFNKIATDGKIIRNPGQKEYATALIQAFNDLYTQSTDLQAVKLLFTVPNSPTFNVSDVVTSLNGGGNGVPPALDLEFIKAGFPLPQEKPVTSLPAKYDETRWAITTVLPEDEAKTITGKIKTADDQSITFESFNDGAKPTAEQLTGLVLQITSEGGTGLSGTIKTYSPGADSTSGLATMSSDWQPSPDNGSLVEIKLSDNTSVKGKVADKLADPKTTIKLSFDSNITPPTDVQGTKGTLTIIAGPGKGLTGTIATYAPDAGKSTGTATMDENWKPTPGPESVFSIEKVTTYTIKAEPDQLDIYANSDDPALLIQYRIGLIDEIISKQLSEILHDRKFQQLEASWRGLHDLVFNSETGTRLKLRLLNVPKQKLQDDLDNAVEFDQSALFKKVYEEEYGVFGGSPYSALLVDYEFTRKPQDINLLEKLSNVAAAAHAPVIAAAAPELFDLDTFTKLDQPRDLAKIFEGAESIKWRGFRDSEDSRYLALVLPHVLMRLPYGPNTVPVGEFNFVEDVVVTPDELAKGKPESAKFLWGSAAWALGQRITTAFSLYGWTAAIRGYEGGGLVSGLPIYTYKTDHGDVAVRIPTEVAITDRREKELSDLGFIALCYRKETDAAAFFGGQTTNKPKAYLQDEATANARLSSQLPYMMAASRFAHYIKVMMRDKIGSFMTQDNVATFLNRWIAQYVLLNDSAGQETKARYPLREARVDVTADPARPGCYRAVVFLRPHFQLEELTVSIRLVTQLPPPANA